MNETMTIEEIRAKYDNHWILIDHPITNDRMEVLSGHVVCASADREEVDRAALNLPKPIDIAIEYTGPMPQHVVVGVWPAPSIL